MILSKLLDANELWKRGVTQNSLAEMTGLSATYLNQLKREVIKKPKRDRIISIGVAINLTSKGISELLKEHGYPNLTKRDADILLNLATNWNIKEIQPLFFSDLFNNIYNISVAKLSGDEILVGNRPPSFFRSSEHRRFVDREIKGIDEESYHYLKDELINKRRLLFEQNISDYKTTHYICYGCFREYINFAIGKKEEKKGGEREAQFLISFLKKILYYLINNKNYELYFIDYCPHLGFYLKYAPNKDLKSRDNKVIFYGQVPVPIGEQHKKIKTKLYGEVTGRMLGYATDKPKIFSNFHFQSELIQESIIDGLTEKVAVCKEIEDCIKELN
ncbi:hypothetical protein HN451_07560 [archaeon]|jgi:transcriptional regulator with XRE-family HTH domain|nr:hypothetical protein [archaeon]